jgi:hypothetical protein
MNLDSLVDFYLLVSNIQVSLKSVRRVKKKCEGPKEKSLKEKSSVSSSIFFFTNLVELI